MDQEKQPTFTIGTRTIGGDNPCFIIAEVGVNHNGSFEQAKKLIDIAVDSGSDAVKFQILTAEGLYIEDAGIDTVGRNAFDIWKDVEVPESWIPKLKQYATEKNILFFSSVFDEKTVDLLDPYVDLYKIASSETSHIPLLKKVAKTGKPVLFSIGGAKLEEVEEAVSAIQEEGNDKIAILHCVQHYPTPLDKANVLAITTLRKRFPNVVVGYSDHSLNPSTIPIASITRGAKIIEKHYTLSRHLPGIDHHMSLEPHELKQLVEDIREAEWKMAANEPIAIDHRLLGDGEVELTPDQEATLQFVRRSIFVSKPVRAGEEFTEENMTIVRPGNRDTTEGFHPRNYVSLLGKTAARDLDRLHLITLRDVSGANQDEHMQNEHTSPTVTLIIRTYNDAEYIKSAIESALNQTAKNYEILIVNDGSSDDTGVIIASFNDSKIRVINQENKGAFESAYVGLRNARGNYITYLDGDDTIEPTYIQDLLDAVRSGEFGFSYCDYTERDLRTGESKHVSLQNIFNCLVSGVLYKKSVLDEVGFWDPAFNLPEYDLIIRIMKKYHGTHVPKSLFVYNRRDGSMTSNPEWLEEAKKQLEEKYGVIPGLKEY